MVLQFVDGVIEGIKQRDVVPQARKTVHHLLQSSLFVSTVDFIH